MKVNKRLQFVLQIVIIASIVGHLLMSPYTKVEESFNLQAIHDMLNYGISPDAIGNYDHIKFPGVVPRTFIGSLLISSIATPIIQLAHWLGIDLKSGDQTDLQLLIRMIIGLINGLLLIKIGSALTSIDFISRKNKNPLALSCAYLFLLASQFHIFYYSSRTLPNFMALPFVNYGVSKLLTGDVTGLAWLSFTGIVFRLEVGVFGVVIAVVSSVVFSQSDMLISDMLINLLMLTVGTVIGAVLSVLIDSYFWGKLMIPELQSLRYNVIEGKSANWGTDPFMAYFEKYIPQLFNPPVVLILAGLGFMIDLADDLSADKRDTNTTTKQVISRPKDYLRILVVSCVVYMFIMSIQPHKEWRFIIYTIPIITLCAGNGLVILDMPRNVGCSTVLKVFKWAFMCLTVVTWIRSVVLGYISSYNYPGGEAVKIVNDLVINSLERTVIHLDVATCMTGASRFGELHNDLIVYDKSETELELRQVWNDIDYLVSEIADVLQKSECWQQVDVVSKFDGVSLIPVFQFIQQHPSPKHLLKFLLDLIIDSITSKDLSRLKLLIDLPIIQTDYLYVYRRINPSDSDEVLILQASEEQDYQVEPDTPDMEQVENQINQDINAVEHSV